MSTIITITGPSAAGKSTLEGMLCRDQNFARLISTTTRPRRHGEPSDAYYFVTDEEFEDTSLVESVEFNGFKYGLSTAEVGRVLSMGKTPVVVVEPDGQRQIAAWAECAGLKVLAVFVGNPLKVRLDRLVKRFISGRTIGKTDFGQTEVDLFVSRLVSAATVEQDWGDDCWRYDVICDRFDEGNSEAVVEAIWGALDQLARGLRTSVLMQ